MSEAKFTKGPWKVCTTNDGFLYIGNDETTDLGPVLGFKPTIAEVYREDDAHLIAAAPEMYWALKSAMARVNDLEIIINEARELGLTLFMCGDTWPEKKAAAEAAIRKAEGR